MLIRESRTSWTPLSALEGSQPPGPPLRGNGIPGRYPPWRVRNVGSSVNGRSFWGAVIRPGGFATPVPLTSRPGHHAVIRPGGFATADPSEAGLLLEDRPLSALEGLQPVGLPAADDARAGRHPAWRVPNPIPGTMRKFTAEPSFALEGSQRHRPIVVKGAEREVSISPGAFAMPASPGSCPWSALSLSSALGGATRPDPADAGRCSGPYGAHKITELLKAALPSGSALVIRDLTAEFAPEETAQATQIYTAAGTPTSPRS